MARAALTTMAIGCLLGGSAAGIGERQSPASPEKLDFTSTGSIAGGIFSSVAFPFKPGIATRWQEIEKNAGQLGPGNCDGDATCRTRLGILEEAVKATQSLPLAQKINAINRAVNRLIDYRSDKDVYGTLDYWAMPKEILAIGKGDCEDFAIMKMAALRSAGVPAESMALVVLRDSGRNFYHAVLAVSTSSHTYVLDNLRDVVLTDRQLPQYQALYSLGAQKAWIHGYKRGSEFAMQKRPTSLETIQPGEGIPNPS
ncbi:transglutaminase-like cysteine peptidase [Borborobacter arsenicus]|uniref:transglutaminase-like cysteine peptidase n=1 Tax=Borborobacter arsenicus TaxID=1851146 RepID=UPI001404458B|nr:transglutaminase-like cysteine peptidase [Pseudaminobacter arsenicus]